MTTVEFEVSVWTHYRPRLPQSGQVYERGTRHHFAIRRPLDGRDVFVDIELSAGWYDELFPVVTQVALVEALANLLGDELYGLLDEYTALPMVQQRRQEVGADGSNHLHLKLTWERPEDEREIALLTATRVVDLLTMDLLHHDRLGRSYRVDMMTGASDVKGLKVEGPSAEALRLQFVALTVPVAA